MEGGKKDVGGGTNRHGETITNLRRPISMTINRQRARIIETNSRATIISSFQTSFFPFLSLSLSHTLSLSRSKSNFILTALHDKSCTIHYSIIVVEICFLSHVYIYIYIYSRFLIFQSYTCHALEINRGKKR